MPFRLPRAAAILVASLIVGVCVVAGVPKASSDPVSISADELLARIERARGIAELGERTPSRAGMESVRSTLGLPVSVRLGHDVVPMAADPFLDTLDGSRADDFSRAIAHLDALAAGVRAAGGAAPISTADVRDALAKAYRDVPRQSFVARYIGSVQRFVMDAISRWIDSLDATHGVGSVLAWGALVLLLAAAAAVLHRLGLGFVPEPAAARPDAEAGIDWRATAERALAGGDVALAVVALYHVLLGALAARGVITGNPAITAGECRAAVARAMPTAYARVVPATEAFERVAYGGRSPSAADVEALRVAARSVEAA